MEHSSEEGGGHGGGGRIGLWGHFPRNSLLLKRIFLFGTCTVGDDSGGVNCQRWEEDKKENEDHEHDREDGYDQARNDRRLALGFQVGLGLRIESGVNAHDKKGRTFPCGRPYERPNQRSVSRAERAEESQY